MKKLIIGSMLVLGMCNVSYAGKMSAAVKFAKGFKAIKSVMGKSIIPKRLKMQASKQGYKPKENIKIGEAYAGEIQHNMEGLRFSSGIWRVDGSLHTRLFDTHFLDKQVKIKITKDGKVKLSAWNKKVGFTGELFIQNMGHGLRSDGGTALMLRIDEIVDTRKSIGKQVSRSTMHSPQILNIREIRMGAFNVSEGRLVEIGSYYSNRLTARQAELAFARLLQ